MSSLLKCDYGNILSIKKGNFDGFLFGMLNELYSLINALVKKEAAI